MATTKKATGTRKKSTQHPNQYTKGTQNSTARSSTSSESLQRLKQQSASEVGVNIQGGNGGDLTAKQAGSVGGQMVKKMVEAYKSGQK